MLTAKISNKERRGRQSTKIKRKYPRTGTSGFVGTLGDGNKIIEAIVGNISTGGFELNDPPESFSAENHTYVVVLSGEGKHFKLLAKPCWRKVQGKDIQLGFKILDAPWKWVEFTI